MRNAIIALPVALVLTASCAPMPPSVLDTTQVYATVSYRERIMLSPDHILSVRVEDVSRADARAVVIAESSRRVEDRGPPFEMKIDVRNERIDPAAVYAVRADIREPDGALRFTTDTHHPVLTRGAPNRVDIVLVGAR